MYIRLIGHIGLIRRIKGVKFNAIQRRNDRKCLHLQPMGVASAEARIILFTGHPFGDRVVRPVQDKVDMPVHVQDVRAPRHMIEISHAFPETAIAGGDPVESGCNR